MRLLALACLPLLACTPDDGLATPATVASVAGPRALIRSGDRAFVATDDGLFSLDRDGHAVRIVPTTGEIALESDGITIDYADAPAGIASLDTRSLASRPIVDDNSTVLAMAATRRDLYWIGDYLDVNHTAHLGLRALDLQTGVVRLVAASSPIDDLYQSDRLSLVADDAAAYVRTNRTLARYDRATGELRVIASKLGVASGLAIEGDDLYFVEYGIATRISIATGERHELGHVVGVVEGIVVDGGVAIIATSEDHSGWADNSDPDGRRGWLFELDGSGVERILAYQPTARIVSVALMPDAVWFAERAPHGGVGTVRSLPR